MPTPSGQKARMRTETLEAAAAKAAAAPVASTPADQVVVTPFCFPHGAEPGWVPVRPRPAAKVAKSTRKPVRKYYAMRVLWPIVSGSDEDVDEAEGEGEEAVAAAAFKSPRVYEVAVGDFALMRTGEGPGGRLFVGEVTDIYLTAAATVEVDVCWMYRPEDATGTPNNAEAGDVELYESSHHDAHQDAPAIIGKAAVTSLESLTATRDAAKAAAAGGDPEAVARLAQLNATDPALHYYVSYFYDHKKEAFKPVSFDKRRGAGGGKAGGALKADTPTARSGAAASPAATPQGDAKAGAPPAGGVGGGRKTATPGSGVKAAPARPVASPTSATAASPAPGGTPAAPTLAPSGRPSRATRAPLATSGAAAAAAAAAVAATPPRKKRKVVDPDGDGTDDVAMSDGDGPAPPAPTPAKVSAQAPAQAAPAPAQAAPAPAAAATVPPPRPATPSLTTTQFISYPWATGDAPDERGDESVASPPLSREPYIRRIADFLRTAGESATAPASSRVLFVSGTAGCGKTDAVRAALARAKPPVVVADIDGKRLFNPSLAYSLLLDAIVVARRGGRRAERVVMAPERARENLTALWASTDPPVVPADDPTPPSAAASPAKPIVVFVLVDDLDVLAMRAPDVVRDLLTWHTSGLSTPGGTMGEAAGPIALAVVGVARRMDLPAASLAARPGTLKLLTNVAQLLVEPYSARDLEAHLLRQPPVKLAALPPPLTPQEAAVTYGPGALAAAAAAVATEGGNVRRVLALASAAAAATRWRLQAAAAAGEQTTAVAAGAAKGAVAAVVGASVPPPEAGSTAAPPSVGAAVVVGAAAGAAAGAVAALSDTLGKETTAAGNARAATAAKGTDEVNPPKAPVDAPSASLSAKALPPVSADTPAAPSAVPAAASTPTPSATTSRPQTPFVVTAADMRAAIKFAAPGTVASTLAAASGSPYALSTAELVVLASATLLCRDAPWVPPPSRFGHAITLSLSGVVAKAAAVAPLAVKGGQALSDQAVHAAVFGLAARGLLAVLPRTDNSRPLAGGLPDCDLILTAPVGVVVTGLRAGPLAKMFVVS